MLSPLASVLRLASFVLCVIVAASFALFVINQTGSASAHQQELLNSGTTAPASAPTASAGGSPQQAPHGRTPRANSSTKLPNGHLAFLAATEAISSQWLLRAANLVLALLIYGFGLAFLARVIRVRL